jgi:hypothetical protein
MKISKNYSRRSRSGLRYSFIEMRKNRLLLTFFILLGALFCFSQSKQIPGQSFLETELSLASSSGLYFIVDIGERRIDLKAKGIFLRTWTIEKIRIWGDPVLTNPVSLMKKSALFPPTREKIKPNENAEEEASFELEALELKDMPSIYRLGLERNISIYVRPKSTGWASFLRKIGPTLRWYFYPPLRTLWTKLKKKSFTAIDITLENKDESKSLYWAIGENPPFIILPP